jgi:hypothetical protein
MRLAILVFLFAVSCGGYCPPVSDMGTHCGNGNVYCSADETCISGDCVPACVFADGGCP